MKYSRPEFYAKATLSSQILCYIHYISMYLDEYWLSSEKKNLEFTFTQDVEPKKEPKERKEPKEKKPPRPKQEVKPKYLEQSKVI